MRLNQREQYKVQIIRERVQRYALEDQIKEQKQEIVALRRLLLEAITCILHRRPPNDEFIERIDKMLRLDKLPD